MRYFPFQPEKLNATSSNLKRNNAGYIIQVLIFVLLWKRINIEQIINAFGLHVLLFWRKLLKYMLLCASLFYFPNIIKYEHASQTSSYVALVEN